MLKQAMENITLLHTGANLLMSKVHLIEAELWIGFYLDYIWKHESSSYPLLRLLRSANQNYYRKQGVHEIELEVIKYLAVLSANNY